MAKVTVIVPVYNVARYIGKCAECLFGQTLDDMQFVFVDDCSPDESARIIADTLLRYPHRAAQTSILRPGANGGLAAARRLGLSAATGDFVAHCDGDDWTDPGLYERMYCEAVASGADVVLCGEILEYAGRQVTREAIADYPTGRERVRNWYHDTRGGMFAHDKLVRRSIYTDHDILPWPSLDMWEDNALMTRVMYHAGKISTVTGCYYHYNRANTGSLTAAYGLRQVRQMMEVARRLGEFFEAQPDYADMRLTALAYKYLAKLNLVTDSYGRLREFRTTWPETREVEPLIPLHSFSTAGKVRHLMVCHHMAPLFVALFKAGRLLGAK